MRFVAVVLALPLLLACRHEFPPSTPTGDVDRDPDGAVPSDQRPAIDRQTTDRSRHDASQPLCTPVAASSADCAKEASWSCVGICDGKHRFACTSTVVREIKCPEEGVCECWVNGKVESQCQADNNGRFGCDRCVEALRNGCCRP